MAKLLESNADPEPLYQAHASVSASMRDSPELNTVLRQFTPVLEKPASHTSALMTKVSPLPSSPIIPLLVLVLQSSAVAFETAKYPTTSKTMLADSWGGIAK